MPAPRAPRCSCPWSQPPSLVRCGKGSRRTARLPWLRGERGPCLQRQQQRPSPDHPPALPPWPTRSRLRTERQRLAAAVLALLGAGIRQDAGGERALAGLSACGLSPGGRESLARPPSCAAAGAGPPMFRQTARHLRGMRILLPPPPQDAFFSWSEGMACFAVVRVACASLVTFSMGLSSPAPAASTAPAEAGAPAEGGPPPGASQPTATVPPSAAGAVELRGVQLWWPGSECAVLTVPQLCIPPGACVALAGKASSGRSSLLLGLLGGERVRAQWATRACLLYRRCDLASCGQLMPASWPPLTGPAPLSSRTHRRTGVARGVRQHPGWRRRRGGGGLLPAGALPAAEHHPGKRPVWPAGRPC